MGAPELFEDLVTECCCSLFLSVGLEINESIPDPKLEEPRQPNTKEKENAVEITIAASNKVSESFTNLQPYCYSLACLVKVSIVMQCYMGRIK